MSPRPELVALAAELRAHLERVRVVVERCRVLAPAGGDDLAAVWAVAGHLHSFYTGCEAILLRAARGFEGAPSLGPHSHRALLDRACLDLPSVRPQVLRPTTARSLEPYLAFRHFFRHAYGAELDWSLMAPKVAQIGSVFEAFSRDLDAFCAFLSRTAEA